MPAVPGKVTMTYADDPEDYRRRLEAKLKPEVIRSTLSFAGLYQVTHEMIKRSVVDDVRGFYSLGFDETGLRYDEAAYSRDVLSKAKDRFRASLLWLVHAEAISQTQADRLDAVYAHRHDLTHELVRYVVDPDFNPDIQLFIDALAILKALRTFWAQIEIDIGSFEHLGEVDADDAVPLSNVVLQMCIDAYLDGIEPSRTA